MYFLSSLLIYSKLHLHAYILQGKNPVNLTVSTLYMIR